MSNKKHVEKYVQKEFFCDSWTFERELAKYYKATPWNRRSPRKVKDYVWKQLFRADWQRQRAEYDKRIAKND